MTVVCLQKAEGMRPSVPALSRLVFSEKEAACHLGISPRTLQAMRVDGSGPPFVQLTSRRIGYAVTALESWIASRSVRSTSAATVHRIGGSL